MKLSEERWQRLMKLLPKWEKGKTWQSMSPDKVLAPLRAREINRCICQRRREEGVAGVRAGNGTGGGDGGGVRVGVSDRFGVGDGTELGSGDGAGIETSLGWRRSRGLSWGRTALRLEMSKALVMGLGLEEGPGMGRLAAAISLESKPGIWGLGGEAQKPSLTLSGRSQCSRWGWGSEGSGRPLQWPSAE